MLYRCSEKSYINPPVSCSFIYFLYISFKCLYLSRTGNLSFSSSVLYYVMPKVTHLFIDRIYRPNSAWHLRSSPVSALYICHLALLRLSICFSPCSVPIIHFFLRAHLFSLRLIEAWFLNPLQYDKSPVMS